MENIIRRKHIHVTATKETKFRIVKDMSMLALLLNKIDKLTTGSKVKQRTDNALESMYSIVTSLVNDNCKRSDAKISEDRLSNLSLSMDADTGMLTVRVTYTALDGTIRPYAISITEYTTI